MSQNELKTKKSLSTMSKKLFTFSFQLIHITGVFHKYEKIAQCIGAVIVISKPDKKAIIFFVSIKSSFI